MRAKVFVALQIAFAAAVIWFAAGSISTQWEQAQKSGFGLRLDWPLITLSGLIVLATYALLIETWRRLVRALGFELAKRDAARIWFVSNLGRYIPGKIWQIGAMGVMAQTCGVSPVAATGSAILINIINLVAGVGIVAITGAGLLGNATVIIVVAATLSAMMVLAPRALSPALRVIERLTGRPLSPVELPVRSIWFVALASFVAWILYGIAFRVFAEAVAPASGGPIEAYVATFTASYLIGYVTLFAPGGVVVREAALVDFLARLQLATGGAGVIIAVASRLWLTVIEVLPGVVYLALGARTKGQTVDD